MYSRWIAIGVLLALSSCSYLSGEEELKQAKIKHQLNGLQIALEEFLGVQPATDTLHPVTSEDTVEAAGHPVDTATEESAAEQHKMGTTSISVVAVVDSLLLIPAAEGEELDPAEQDAALRRERLVRTALGNNLYPNRFFQVIQPTQDQRDKIRLDIIATNGSSLAPQEAAAAGAEIGVDHLIWAIIEKNGEEVNVVAQRIDNGRVVYNETLSGWDIFDVPESQDEE